MRSRTARSPAKANKASAAPPKCCRVARVDTCRAVDGSTVPKLGYARLPILCLCLGRVTHAGQIDARLCVLALGARPGASLGHSDGRQDYDARRKSAAVIEIIMLVAQEHDQRQSPVDRHGRWTPTEKPGRNADAPGLI